MASSSIRNYVRTFANPLLAMAFKDGVDYVGDPDFRALEPKKEGDVWEVLIEHEVEDDDDDYNEVDHSGVVHTPMGPLPIKSYASTANAVTPETKKQLSLKDYEDKLNKMSARPARSQQFELDDETGMLVPKKEIIHPPVKVEANEPEPLPPTPTLTKSEPIIMFDPSATDDVEPCKACLNCVSGQPCINQINAACIATMPRKHGSSCKCRDCLD